VIGRKWTLKHRPPPFLSLPSSPFPFSPSSSLFLFFKNGFHKHEKFAHFSLFVSTSRSLCPCLPSSCVSLWSRWPMAPLPPLRPLRHRPNHARSLRAAIMVTGPAAATRRRQPRCVGVCMCEAYGSRWSDRGWSKCTCSCTVCVCVRALTLHHYNCTAGDLLRFVPGGSWLRSWRPLGRHVLVQDGQSSGRWLPAQRQSLVRVH
jgi:hypothetical protein